jgi:membrane protease YdiL (CAAX protease family)
VSDIGSSGVASANPNYEFGPFGRSFLGKFPTKGTLILFALSFLFALIISGGIFGFFFLFSLFNGLIFFLTYFHLEPHFNSKIDSNHKQQLRDFSLDVNSTIGDLGRLFSGAGESAKTQVWDMSEKINFDSIFSEITDKEPIDITSWKVESKFRIWLKVILVWFGLYFVITSLSLFSVILMYAFDFSNSGLDLFAHISWLFSYLSIGVLFYIAIILDGKQDYLTSLFNRPRLSKASLLIVFVLMVDFLLVLAYSFFYDLLFEIPNAELEFFADTSSANDPLILFLIFVVLAICAPFFEEMIFRGYILDSLRRMYSDIAAIIISGVFFGFWHYAIFDPLNFFQVGQTMIGGFLYAWLRLRTGSIWPCIVCHFIWNGTIFFFEFIV